MYDVHESYVFELWVEAKFELCDPCNVSNANLICQFNLQETPEKFPLMPELAAEIEKNNNYCFSISR